MLSAVENELSTITMLSLGPSQLWLASETMVPFFPFSGLTPWNLMPRNSQWDEPIRSRERTTGVCPFPATTEMKSLLTYCLALTSPWSPLIRTIVSPGLTGPAGLTGSGGPRPSLVRV